MKWIQEILKNLRKKRDGMRSSMKRIIKNIERDKGIFFGLDTRIRSRIN